MFKYNLISVSADAKTVKGEIFGWLTAILYFAPSDESKEINVCPHASAGCRAACLYTAGMGKFKNVKEARIRRTLHFAHDRQDFLAKLKADISVFEAVAKSQGKQAAVRLNGTSDLPWENMGIMQDYPNCRFYDYTKNVNRMLRYLRGEMPANYYLLFSRSETNQADCEKVLAAGGNVAVVFEGKTFPTHFAGFRVVSGDESDLRFLDDKNVVVGLKEKGLAKKDDKGFVIRSK